MAKIQLLDQIDEIMAMNRQFRKAIPRMITSGQITQEEANQRVARQNAALKTLQYLNENRDAFLQTLKKQRSP